MARYRIAVVLSIAGVILVPCLSAQTGATPVKDNSDTAKRIAKQKGASESPRLPSAKAAQPATRASTSTTISEVLGQNISLDAHKFLRIFAKSDFSGAERASFGIYADPSVDISKTSISVWWAVPGAAVYSVQDVISGSDFPFTNSGGGNVPVYGTTLFVDVANNGDGPVTIQQLTVYAVAH